MVAGVTGGVKMVKVEEGSGVASEGTTPSGRGPLLPGGPL